MMTDFLAVLPTAVVLVVGAASGDTEIENRRLPRY